MMSHLEDRVEPFDGVRRGVSTAALGEGTFQVLPMTTRRHAAAWSRAELSALRRLSTPRRIQDFLDRLDYRSEDQPASPRGVLAERRAHCFDGALLAAAALRRLGHPPLLFDLRSVRDDDHVLALFRVDGCWGAVAKSNFAGLRYREPVHRTLRELALGYFEPYYNLRRERTLREHSAAPFDLRRYDRLGWEFEAAVADRIAERLNQAPHRSLLTPRQVGRLTRLDQRAYHSGMVGTDLAGVLKR
jgi:hypothetical protein